ncbi:murein hydrolase activator [Bathymodiolus japonicus methanotrophic gill symbiont]|nr:murein hydrolase activator [Bathymodiolus japonicus methanotrophic gill symbiont]
MAAASKDQELLQLQGKIKALADNLSSLSQQKNQAGTELKRIEQQYGEISRTAQDLNAHVALKHKRIDAIQQEIQLQNGWLLTQQSQLAEQVKTAYALGPQEQLKLLLNQQDINRSSRVMTYYRYFNQARINKLQHINTSLEQEKQQEKQELAKLIAANKLLLQEKLSSSKAERKQILAQIKKDQARHATSRNSGTPVAIIRSPTQRMGDALNALRPQRLRTKAASSLLPHWLDGYSECNSCSSRVLLAHVESANCPVAYQGLKITTSLSSVSMIFSE